LEIELDILPLINDVSLVINNLQNRTEQNRNFITLKLLQFLVTQLHRSTKHVTLDYAMKYSYVYPKCVDLQLKWPHCVNESTTTNTS